MESFAANSCIVKRSDTLIIWSAFWCWSSSWLGSLSHRHLATFRAKMQIPIQ